MTPVLALLGTLFVATPAVACPMADAAAYQEAAAAVDAAKGTKLVLAVQGMTCGDCSEKLAKMVMAVEGVAKAAFDYQTGEAKIAFSDAKTSPEALLKLIEDAGYTASITPSA